MSRKKHLRGHSDVSPGSGTRCDSVAGSSEPRGGWRSIAGGPNRRRAAREGLADVARPVESADELLVAGRRAAQLWSSIDALPEKLRIVIVLSAIEGHDVQEVAGLLGIPPGTVKSRLFLARKALAEKLRCLENNPTTR